MALHSLMKIRLVRAFLDLKGKLLARYRFWSETIARGSNRIGSQESKLRQGLKQEGLFSSSMALKGWKGPRGGGGGENIFFSPPLFKSLFRLLRAC